MTARWILIIMALVIGIRGTSQCLSKQFIWDSILVIEKNAQLSLPESKKKLLSLKVNFEKCQYEKDSVYARLLHRLAAISFQENHRVATEESLGYLSEAIYINSSGKPSAAINYLVNSYYNMGLFYRSLKSYRKASLFFDSTIITDARLNTRNPFSLWAGYYRASLFFVNGEFQKSIDQCNRSLINAKATNNGELQMLLLNELSQSCLYMDRHVEALEAATQAELLADELKDSYEKASALKNRARVLSEQHKLGKAEELFRAAIRERLKSADYAQISDDYIDFGVFFLDGEEYPQSKVCFQRAIEYARKNEDREQLSKAWLNLAVVELDAPSKNYALAEKYLNHSLQYAGIQKSNIYEDIYLKEIATIGNKKLLISVLRTKADLLLRFYKEGLKKTLDKSIQTAKLTDSLLSEMRLEQTEEQSKLYWQNLTRSFFGLALEACYLSGDMATAFYFMEKSRAVLLYEKINEHAAALLLPESETQKERRFKYQIVAVERLLDEGIEKDKNQLQLMVLKDSLEHHVKFLEAAYPAYYRIKYASDIPTLDSFQKYLSGNGEAFIHYFFHKNHGFAFVVAGSGSTMHEIDVSPADFSDFMYLCSNKQRLNNGYPTFSKLAEKLYLQLFAPLNIKQERVIVCMDNYLLPFEAFRTDSATQDFLIAHHTFSYAYSAAALLFEKKHQKSPTNMFAGFAPVSFAESMSLPDLKLSGKWLDKLGTFYNSNAIFINEGATKHNFIQSLSSYSIVNVFSHATADTIEMEPVLYLQDSSINLRELQAIDRSSAQLVMLSACQTNVGRNESGEGIYSLARGFSTIGIPSVTSTLWTADEEATYWISEKFHLYLRDGLNKDIALKKAKLDFMRSGMKASLLPYYWANIVLVGNSSMMDFSKMKSVGALDLVVVLLLMGAAFIVCWLLYRLIRE